MQTFFLFIKQMDNKTDRLADMTYCSNQLEIDQTYVAGPVRALK